MYKDDRKIRPGGPSLLQCHFRIEYILWKILAEESKILETIPFFFGPQDEQLQGINCGDLLDQMGGKGEMPYLQHITQ